ncbi:hypothetical protein QVD17_11900 [Tagetes erecta]|uniref:Uncharacterized protein n=1 Tax=Tagetes erecta TaxID=13708 RepID=A0AAD8L1L2_TARER|nr:hypothetical protein QVD17_11900 [Tagetes erecta]
MVLRLWWIRKKHEEFDPVKVYELGDPYPTFIKHANTRDSRKKLALEWNEVGQEHEVTQQHQLNHEIFEMDYIESMFNQDEGEGEVNKGDEIMGTVIEGDGKVNEGYGDQIEDIDNIVENVNVDMDSFNATFQLNTNLDKDGDNEIEDEIECEIHNFESASADEDVSLLDNALKKCRKRKKKSKNNDEGPFYVGQSFIKKEDVKTRVTNHAKESRRQLYFYRNEQLRFTVMCLGVNPIFVSSGESVKSRNTEGANGQESSKVYGAELVDETSQEGGTISKDAPNTKKRGKKDLYLHVLGDYTFLGNKKNDSWIEPLIETNPGLPLKALQDLIQKKHQVEVGLQKSLGLR